MRRISIFILIGLVILMFASALLPQLINQPQTGCLSETTLTQTLQKRGSSELLETPTEVSLRDGTVYVVLRPFRWYGLTSTGGDDQQSFVELMLGTSADYVLEGNEVIVLLTFYPRDTGFSETALEEAAFNKISEDAVYVPFMPEFDSVIATCQLAAGYRQANIVVALNEKHYLRVDVQSFNDPMQYMDIVRAIISRITEKEG